MKNDYREQDSWSQYTPLPNEINRPSKGIHDADFANFHTSI
jgi:hypothetical protein